MNSVLNLKVGKGSSRKITMGKPIKNKIEKCYLRPVLYQWQVRSASRLTSRELCITDEEPRIKSEDRYWQNIHFRENSYRF